jgi:hypothetical protein
VTVLSVRKSCLHLELSLNTNHFTVFDNICIKWLSQTNGVKNERKTTS